VPEIVTPRRALDLGIVAVLHELGKRIRVEHATRLLDFGYFLDLHAVAKDANLLVTHSLEFDADGTALPFADYTFDVVVSRELLERIDPAGVIPILLEMKRLTKRRLILDLTTGVTSLDTVVQRRHGGFLVKFNRDLFQHVLGDEFTLELLPFTFADDVLVIADRRPDA
jgi:hypothetical protein